MKWSNVLAEAIEQHEQGIQSFFVAHLLDRILVGKICDEQDFPILRKAADQERILELHIFNTEKAIYAVWENDRVVRYADLTHQDHVEYIEYEYELEDRYSRKHRVSSYPRDPSFQTVVTRTYIKKNDEANSAMPRIGQTVLYELR
mgnify:CR=1 FL=1